MRKAMQHRLLLAVALAALLVASCGRGKRINPADLQGSVEPDRMLYEQALEDLRRGNHTVARLNLQTLINTYPDSDYLAKAKLAIADSYFTEGGTAGLTQAVAEYKDFITFFPFLAEAAYAQYQVALAHYRRMEKPDRDRTQARLAEAELQTFLLKHPDHELAAQAEQKLREVQEVIAEGEYRVALYYFIKGNMRAAGGRLLELVDRYPLYSRNDRALWMLGEAYEKSERGDIATRFFARIVRDYPLSSLVEDSKRKLTRYGAAIPQPDPAALERMQLERDTPRSGKGLFTRATLGIFKTGPDISRAARHGRPNLSPPGESSGTTLSGGASEGTPGSTVVVETPGGTVAGAGKTAQGQSSSQELDRNTKKKDTRKKKEEESSSKRRPG